MSQVVRRDVLNPTSAYDALPADRRRELVELAFNGRVIDSATHPVVLEYQGRRG